MDIALFGGSFNPPHRGHTDIAQKILLEGIVDEVWFIPCKDHPFGKELIPGQKRMDMLKQATQGNDRVKISDIELSMKGPSYSAKTMQEIRRQFPENTFYFVIGSDNLPTINRWSEFAYLKEEVEFIVVKRPEFSLENPHQVNIYHTIDMEDSVSSTQVRQLLTEKKSTRNLLHPYVEAYIANRGLYHG